MVMVHKFITRDQYRAENNIKKIMNCNKELVGRGTSSRILHWKASDS